MIFVIPIILGAAAIASAAFGGVKAVEAVGNMNEAKEIGERACSCYISITLRPFLSSIGINHKTIICTGARYQLSVQLASKELNFTAAEVEAALINEESLLPFLRQVPGGNALKMQELGLGEFAVKGITQSEGGDRGTSYKLQLADGRAVWARGNVATLLESGWQPRPDKPLTLIVTRIEELGEDRFTVDCALRERLPKLPTATPNGNGRQIAPSEGKAIDVEVKAAEVVTEPTLRVVSSRPEILDMTSIPSSIR